MPRKKKTPDVPKVPEEIMKQMEPDMRKCIDMYTQIMDIIYKDPKIKILEIDIIVNLVASKLMDDKIQISLRRYLTQQAKIPEEKKSVEQRPTYFQ